MTEEFAMDKWSDGDTAKTRVVVRWQWARTELADRLKPMEARKVGAEDRTRQAMIFSSCS